MKVLKFKYEMLLKSTRGEWYGGVGGLEWRPKA